MPAARTPKRGQNCPYIRNVTPGCRSSSPYAGQWATCDSLQLSRARWAWMHSTADGEAMGFHLALLDSTAASACCRTLGTPAMASSLAYRDSPPAAAAAGQLVPVLAEIEGHRDGYSRVAARMWARRPSCWRSASGWSQCSAEGMSGGRTPVRLPAAGRALLSAPPGFRSRSQPCAGQRRRHYGHPQRFAVPGLLTRWHPDAAHLQPFNDVSAWSG